MKIRQSFVANSSTCSFYISLNKDEDAHCKFTYEKDNRKYKINLTNHYKYDGYDAGVEEILGAPIDYGCLFDYTPKSYDDIYDMILRIIDLFIKFDFKEDEYSRIFEQTAFNVCNADPFIAYLIKHMAKCYLDWVKEEVENNSDVYTKDLKYHDFTELLRDNYIEKIQDTFWESCIYKEKDKLIEVEFYQSIKMKDALETAFEYCIHYIKLLVYLYKYNKKVQELYIGYKGDCTDEYSESVIKSWINNGKQFEDANFEVLNIAYD